MRRLVMLPLVCLYFSSCGSGSKHPAVEGEERCGDRACLDTEVCDPVAERCREILPDLCRAPTAWQPGMVAFREATAKWSLAEIGVEGVRLSVADVDGDGWADLFVRRGGTSRDDFTDGGSRSNWLLRNVGGERFEDFTLESGLLAPRQVEPTSGRPAEVTVFADVNGDGFVDAFTGVSFPTFASLGQEKTEIMLNDGTGRFVLGPQFPGSWKMVPVVIGGAAFVDVDRDGIVDLFVGHGAISGSPQHDRLYRGLGDGSFEEITGLAGLETEGWRSAGVVNEARGHSNAWGVAACDLNGDGDPELLVSSYGRAPNHLWQSLGGDDPLYENRSIESGYAFDQRQDWTDNESARCWCMRHPADEGCFGVPPPALIRCESDADAFRWNHATDREPYRLGGNSGTTVCADVNGDGFLDLLTTEIVHWDVGSSSDPSELLLNLGAADVAFERPGNSKTGLARSHSQVDWNDGDMTAAVFDFDNDGRPDVYIGSSDYPGTRGHLFRQLEDGTFAELPLDLGIDHRSSHGIAVADFDRDGDLDVIVGHSRTRCEGGDHCYEKATVRFFENVIGQDGNWIQLDLRGGPGTNPSAIGARIEVRTPDRLQVQEIGGGHGHYGIQHDLVAHFGLGAACEAEVTIRWPNRELETQRFQVQSGYRYRVEQGEMPVVRP